MHSSCCSARCVLRCCCTCGMPGTLMGDAGCVEDAVAWCMWASEMECMADAEVGCVGDAVMGVLPMFCTTVIVGIMVQLCCGSALGSMCTASDAGWFTAQTVGCALVHTGVALLWTRASHTGDVARCIGDAVTGCVGNVVHSRVMVLAWCALGIDDMMGATSASCTVATEGIVMQPCCSGVLGRSVGATGDVGRLVAQMARRVGIWLVPFALVTWLACSTAGAVMQPHCSAVLGRIGAALSWSHAPGAGDMGKHTLRIVLLIQLPLLLLEVLWPFSRRPFHSPLLLGLLYLHSLPHRFLVSVFLFWTRHNGLEVVWELGPSECVGHERERSWEHGCGSRNGDVAFDAVTCHMVTRPCHIKCRVGDSGSQAFCKGVETAVRAFDGGETIFAGEVFMKPICDGEPVSEVVHLDPPSQRVSNTTYVAGEDLDFRGPEGCCQV
ncbi:hypothetical protein BKA93DRAFT_747260 [Sparassis latifolia]